MVGVVGVHAHVIRIGHKLETPVWKGGYGAWKRGGDLFACVAAREGYGDGGKRIGHVVSAQNRNVRPVCSIHLRIRREPKCHDLGGTVPPWGTDPFDKGECLRVVGANNHHFGSLLNDFAITVKIFLF